MHGVYCSLKIEDEIVMKIAKQISNSDDITACESADGEPVSMQKIKELRRSNLRVLAGRYGTSRQFLNELKSHGVVWSPGYLSAMIGKNPTRAVSESTARTIESALELPAGTLDIVSYEEFKGVVVNLTSSVTRYLSNRQRHGIQSTHEEKPEGQLISPNSASDIDTSPINLPSGSAKSQRINKANLMTEVLEAVMQCACAGGNDALNPKYHGKIIYLVYEDALLKGAVDPDFVENLFSITA